MATSPAAFKLRLPQELRAQLQGSADQRGNSLNGEICRRLGMSFKMDELRGAYAKEVQERAATQQRCNALTDYVLALTSPKVPASQAVYGPGLLRRSGMSAGCIVKRGENSWRLKYDVGRDPISGKRITKYRTVTGANALPSRNCARSSPRSTTASMPTPAG